MKNLLVACACPALLVLLAGCATPKEALDSANNGALMTAAFDNEMANFRRVQADAAARRRDVIRYQNATALRVETAVAMDDRIKAAAGLQSQLALQKTLLDLSESRLLDEKTVDAKLAELDANMAKLTAPLPDNSAKLKEAQKAIAAMGVELSPSERFELAKLYVNATRDAIDATKKKISEAETVAAAAGAATKAAQDKAAAKAANAAIAEAAKK